MHRLRAPGGCPWDAEQTHDTLKPYLIEEAYEVLEAIEDGGDPDLREELGDLLLQVVFHAELAAERDAFDINDIVQTLCDKLVRRHPHVFGDLELESSREVAASWTRIKAAEKAQRHAGNEALSVLTGVPKGLPALVRAHRLGERAASVGFDWPSPGAVRQKIDEELAELDEAARSEGLTEIAEELGDLLFATASYARSLGLNAENVLRSSLDRFCKRFRAMEEAFSGSAENLQKASPEELDAAWQRAKRR